MNKITLLTSGFLLSFGIFFFSCRNQSTAGDNVLFGISERFESFLNPTPNQCSTDVTISTRAISLSEDGDVNASFDSSSDNFLTETDTDGGTSWGYQSFETCIYLNQAFSGSVTIPISTNSTYTGRINTTRSFPLAENGNPLPSEFVFTAHGVSERQCLRFTRVNDGIRNPIEDPFLIEWGSMVQRNGSGQIQTNGLYASQTPCNVRVSMEDDEGPGIRVSNISRVMEEPGTPPNDANFQVVLRTAPLSNVTININDRFDAVNANNREGTTSPTTLTFTPANFSTPQSVTVTSVDDAEVDGLKAYTIRLQKTVSTDTEYNGIKPRDVVVYNKDKSVPGYAYERFNSTSGTTTTTGGTITGFATDENNQFGFKYANFKLKLRSKPSASVTLAFSSNCGSKCQILDPNLTFTTSNWNTYQTVRVRGNSDSANVGNEDYDVTFVASSTDPIYNTTVVEPAFRIRSCDNDGSHLIQPCNFSGSPIGTTGSRFSASEPANTSFIWLITKSDPTGTVTVPLSSDDTTEGTVPASVTITSGSSGNYNVMENSSTNRILMTHADDSIVDGSQNWTVITAESTGSLTYNPFDIYATTTDNENYFYVNVTGNTQEGTTTAATISVCLGANNANEPITINIACAVSGDECGNLSASSIVFPTNSQVSIENASNANCPNDVNKRTFTVQGFEDLFADGTQSFSITLTKAATTDPAYSTAPNPSSPSVSNLDNEPAGKAVFVATLAVNGEMTAQGVRGGDDICNSNRPSGVPSGTYKALLVSDSSGEVLNDRKPGTDWPIAPNLHYYRCSAAGAANCSDEFTRLFIADSQGKFNPTTLPLYFSTSDADEFWTGLGATSALNPATQASTPGSCLGFTYKHNCHGFTYVNCDSNALVNYYGQIWKRSGGTIVSEESVCSNTKKLICIQQ